MSRRSRTLRRLVRAFQRAGRHTNEASREVSSPIGETDRQRLVESLEAERRAAQKVFSYRAHLGALVPVKPLALAWILPSWRTDQVRGLEVAAGDALAHLREEPAAAADCDREEPWP